MHKTQANQKVHILQLEIAVPDDAEDAEVRDEISALLTEAGIASLDGNLLDWRYTGIERLATAGEDPQEGEIFTGNAGGIELPGTMITKIRPMTFDEARWLFWEYNDHSISIWISPFRLERYSNTRWSKISTRRAYPGSWMKSISFTSI